MEFDCKREAEKAIALLDTLKSSVCEMQPSKGEENEMLLRRSKMTLLKLKVLTRSIYANIQQSKNQIEEEMNETDKILVNVNKMESEIGGLKRMHERYISFTMPEYRKVYALTAEEEGLPERTTFEKNVELLKEELQNRKRLQEELDVINDTKKQKMNDLVYLKHHLQTVVSQKMNHAEEALRSASAICNQIGETKEEEEEVKSPEESGPVETPIEEDN